MSHPASAQPRSALLPAAIAALGGFLFGFDSGVINGAVAALTAAFGSSAAVTGFNVASMLLGCAAGAFVAGRVADAFGRRATLFVSAAVFAFSAWGSGVATGSGEFVAYRLLGGLAVGAASVICPAYIAEIAPAAQRGRLATLQQLAIVLGLFSAFLSNYLIAHAAGSAEAAWLLGHQAWRWMFWMEIAPSFALLVGLTLIPESPRYLIAAGRKAEAAQAFVRLGAPGDGRAETEEVARTVAQDRRPSFRDLLSPDTGRVRPVVWVGVMLAAFQQLVGINVVFYYGEVLWRAAGFSEADALKINVIGGLINITATLVAIALVDRVGRKPLLLAGSALMTVFLGLLAAVFARAQTGADGNLVLDSGTGTLALVAANLYIIGFGISWGPVMWVLLGEIFPNQMRGAALSIAGLVQWVANFAVTISFPVLLAGVGLGGAYGLYAVIAALSGFCAWRYVKETKGKTLEEIGEDSRPPDAARPT